MEEWSSCVRIGTSACLREAFGEIGVIPIDINGITMSQHTPWMGASTWLILPICLPVVSEIINVLLGKISSVGTINSHHTEKILFLEILATELEL